MESMSARWNRVWGQDALIGERATLLQKKEQVRARVEAMIGRLKAMEHGS